MARWESSGRLEWIAEPVAGFTLNESECIYGARIRVAPISSSPLLNEVDYPAILIEVRQPFAIGFSEVDACKNLLTAARDCGLAKAIVQSLSSQGVPERLEGSTITLANRTGVLSTALSAILSPLGLLAIAAAAVGYSIFEAGQQFEAMEGTVLATGDASGYTAGQLIGMADKIGQSTGSISNATEAVQKLAESGRFAGQNLQLVATAAADMSALTGESVESCVAQINGSTYVWSTVSKPCSTGR